ncbi:MAG TPA: cytochrome c [Flavisolibacter sp.]|nr:cytochrome c [Flavisolibacter sp.]
MFDFVDALHGSFPLQNFSSKRHCCSKQSNNEINSSTTSTVVSSKGEQLFKQNCASCHALDRDLTGPALHGVAERGPWAEDKNNLKKWIRNPMSFISINAYAKNLKAKYGTPMPAQTQLSDADVEEVIGYITQ